MTEPEEPAPGLSLPSMLAIATAAVLAVVVAVGWFAWSRSTVVGTATSASSDTTHSTGAPTSKSSATLPVGAVQCPQVTGQTGDLTTSARGNDHTSCPFAEETRIAYAQSGATSSEARDVTVFSPVTTQKYTMSCRVTAAGPLVTCTGGNDAVVFLY